VDLFEVFGSVTRVKILRILFRYGEAHVNRLAELLGINARAVRHHVNVLKRVGLVVEYKMGNLKVITLNYDDPRVRLLREIFNILEQLCS